MTWDRKLWGVTPQVTEPARTGTAEAVRTPAVAACALQLAREYLERYPADEDGEEQNANAVIARALLRLHLILQHLTPYQKHCSQPYVCAGKSNCQRNPGCID